MSACAQNYHINTLTIDDGSKEVLLDFEKQNCQFFPANEYQAIIICVDPLRAIEGLATIHPALKSLKTVKDVDLLQIKYSVSACTEDGFEVQPFVHDFEKGTFLRLGSFDATVSGFIYSNHKIFTSELLNDMFDEDKVGRPFGNRKGTQFIS